MGRARRRPENYVFHPYPSVRYHADGSTRTINSKEEEADGWHDDPSFARAEGAKIAADRAARAAREKEEYRRQRDREQAALKELAGTDQRDDTGNGLVIPPVEGSTAADDSPPSVYATSNPVDPDVAWPSKSEVGRMNKDALLELAGKLDLVIADGLSNTKIKAAINTRLGR